MTYIYDIILNFQDKYYEFFEWDVSDKIVHIKKIPLIRVGEKEFSSLKYNNVKISKKVINMMKNKTSCYSNKNICVAFLVSNSKQALGVLFNENGNLLKRSSLIFEESSEVEEETIKLSKTTINFEKNSSISGEIISRINQKKKSIIEKFITSNKNKDILQYIYYECYGKEKNNFETIKKKLLNEKVESNLNKIYNTICLFNKANKKLVN